MDRNLLFWSSEEVENHGTNTVAVTNSITLDHNVAIYAVYFIAGVKCIELVHLVYRLVQHKLKKKYAT